MDEAIETLPEQENTPQETQSSKRKRGIRAKNKIPETVYIVNEVGVAGEQSKVLQCRRCGCEDMDGTYMA